MHDSCHHGLDMHIALKVNLEGNGWLHAWLHGAAVEQAKAKDSPGGWPQDQAFRHEGLPFQYGACDPDSPESGCTGVPWAPAFTC